MTKAQLAELLTARTAAHRKICQTTGLLKDYGREERRAIDDASTTFRTTDTAIVKELQRRNEPVTLKVGSRTSLLWLLQVGDQFVELDPATGRPFGWSPKSFSADGQTLYRYPSPAAAS